jgi:hypothetical protein
MPKKDPKTEGKTVNVNGVKMQMKSIIKDRAGTEYYSTYAKEDFKILPDDRSISLFDVNSLEMRKFLKGFLTVKESLL